MSEELSRQCNKCGEIRDIEQFRRNTNRPSRSLSCKPCGAKMTAQWRANQPEDVRIRYVRDHDLKSRYGVSIETYEEMFDAQGGVCAICGQNPEKSLAVDHDHETNELRMLLCRLCNAALGFFGDDIYRLESAVVYLKKFKGTSGQ